MCGANAKIRIVIIINIFIFPVFKVSIKLENFLLIPWTNVQMHLYNIYYIILYYSPEFCVLALARPLLFFFFYKKNST